MRVTTNVAVSVNYLRVIRKSLDLTALFAASTRTVREINRIENRAGMVRTSTPFAKSQEEKRSVRRISLLNAQLSHQESSHIHAVGFKMSGFMVSSDSGKDLFALSKRLKQIHHRRHFFHRR